MFVKPARLGSSVGITKVHDAAELGPAVELALRHDEKVLVEEFVDGRRGRVRRARQPRPAPIASVAGEIVPHAEWYDYSAKYDEGGMDLVVPPRIPRGGRSRACRSSRCEAFVATECEGMARVDFFVRDDGEVVVNEMNTIPGFTSTSVYAQLFEASGSRTASCSTGSSSSRSSATSAAARPRVLSPSAEDAGVGIHAAAVAP